MPPIAEPAVPLTGLPAWISRRVTESDDGGTIVAGIGQSLVVGGVPVRLVGFGTRSLNAIHRGFLLAWRPGTFL